MSCSSTRASESNGSCRSPSTSMARSSTRGSSSVGTPSFWRNASNRPAALGREPDFSFTTFSIPIVHVRLVPLFERLALWQQVQLLPDEVMGQKAPYLIINVLRVLACIDDARCERVEYWEARGWGTLHGRGLLTGQGAAHCPEVFEGLAQGCVPRRVWRTVSRSRGSSTR